MTHQDQSREAFELHVLAPTGIYEKGAGWITRNPDGSYRYTNIQERWTTWQAALNHKAADVVLPEPDFRLSWRPTRGVYVVDQPGIESTDCYTPETVRALLAAAPSVPQGWMPVGERLPESGKPVLLDIGKKHPIRAMWAAKFTIEAGDDDPGWGEYNEDVDMYYCPEGWYEWNEHEECHWRVSADPIRWTELPQPPKEQT